MKIMASSPMSALPMPPDGAAAGLLDAPSWFGRRKSGARQADRSTHAAPADRDMRAADAGGKARATLAEIEPKAGRQADGATEAGGSSDILLPAERLDRVGSRLQQVCDLAGRDVVDPVDFA